MVKSMSICSFWNSIGLHIGRTDFQTPTALIQIRPNEGKVLQLPISFKEILSPFLLKIELFLVYCLYQYKFKASYGDKSGVSDLGHYRQ